MREILFRGKRLDNGEWVEGYLYEHKPPLVGIVSENDVPEPSKWFIARTGFADWNMPRPVELVEVDPSTVGQYTGRKDKNGKRIFEGNILNFDGTVFVCYWDDGNLEFGLRNSEESIGMAYMAVYDAEIIGNIHDNKILLNNQEPGE